MRDQSTQNTPTTRRHEPWIVPGTCVVIGAAYLIIGLAHGDPVQGFTGLGIMLAYCVGLLLFRRRTETAALLSADATDERQVKILVRSMAFSGQVLILVIVGGLFWSRIAGNQYVDVFTALGAIGGATFIGGVLWNSRRG